MGSAVEFAGSQCDGQFSRPRLQIATAASDASCGVKGRDWMEHPAMSVFAR